MGLEKAILHGKEKRKPYKGGKAFDPLCRNHNWCPVCNRNRQYFNNKALDKANSQLKEIASPEDS